MQVLIDGEDGKISGDIDFEKVSQKVQYITPVPGRSRTNDNSDAYDKYNKSG